MAKQVDILADFKISPARKLAYEPRDGSRAVPVPAVSSVATVHRGRRVRDGLPVLYVQNGDATMALPLSAIGAAIAHNLITAGELAALTGKDESAA